MKNIGRFGLIILLGISLASCKKEASCADSDVVRDVKNTLENLNFNFSSEIRAANLLSISSPVNIVTVEKDTSTGALMCHAEIKTKIENSEITKGIDYGAVLDVAL